MNQVGKVIAMNTSKEKGVIKETIPVGYFEKDFA